MKYDAPPGAWLTDEFASSILGGSSRHKAVAVLVAYFDESGISARDKVTLVGGAVATSMTWARLERPWKKKLQEFGIGCFHAVDCENGEREFARMDRPLRDALAWGLSEAFATAEPQCFASGVVRADWQYASAEIRDTASDDPYFLSVWLCLEQISAWSKQHADGEPVAIVFAKQQTYEARAETFHRVYQSLDGMVGIGSLAFAEPKLVIPLQAADFVAYESYRFACDRLAADEATPLRRLWKNLDKGGRGAMSFMLHDRRSLESLGALVSSES